VTIEPEMPISVPQPSFPPTLPREMQNRPLLPPINR
jgi:hypothetical protein